MMEFLDLTPYSYLRSPIPMRSVGWLGREAGIQGADRSPTTDADLQRLRARSTRLANLTLGWHECEFCAGDKQFSGNGEYHYYLADGDVYSAPMMVVHYVEEHDYRMPEDLRQGLLDTRELHWDARADRLREILADESQDDDFRTLAVTDLPQWRDPRAYQALKAVLRDQMFVDIAGLDIGRSLRVFSEDDFPADLKSADLPDAVRYGMTLPLQFQDRTEPN